MRQDIVVHPKPLSAFDLSSNRLCGIPDSVQFTNLSEGALNYEWDFGDGQSSLDTDPLIIYNAAGQFTVQLIATNEFACKDTSFQSLDVNLQPEVDFDPQFIEECEGFTAVFNNFTTGADFLEWNFGDGGTSNEESPTYTYNTRGTYDLKLFAAFNNTCFDSLVIPGAVTIFPGPTAGFTWKEDLSFEPGGLIEFTNTSFEAVSYLWDFADGATSTEENPIHEYLNNDVWQAILVAFHENGCTDTVQQEITPAIFYKFFAPNAFSPEHGIGDVTVFKPTGIGIEEYLIQVFSPWGELLWESEELDGETPVAAWDGTYKGNIMPQGAYAWKATIKYINGLREVRVGSVTLLR